MTEVFRGFSQPLEAISRHIHTVAGEPEWSSSLTSKPAVNINVFKQVSPTSLHQHSAVRTICINVFPLVPDISKVIFTRACFANIIQGLCCAFIVTSAVFISPAYRRVLEFTV
jgi:hypothetical protein